LLVSALTLAVALAAVGAAQSRSGAGSIDIGWVGDKSGATVASQLPSLHGIEAAFRYVNTHGGVNGKTINLVEKDDAYNPATELTLVKSLIQDDHVPLIMGLNQSTGFNSVLPILNATHTLGLATQSVLKSVSDPFQPYIYAGSCSYADQVDVGLAYGQRHLSLKSLKGVTVGVAAIQVASGQEVVDELTKLLGKAGANLVVEWLPPAAINADVQVQDMQSKGVKFYFLHASAPGAVAWFKSEDKFGFTPPGVGTSSITDATVFTTAPYSAVKDFVGTNCFDPPYLAKTAAAKRVGTLGKQYGIATDSDLTSANFTGGWTNGILVAQALKNANGDYSAAGLAKGFEKISKFDPAGGMTPLLTISHKCHIAWPNPRPYLYNFNRKGFQPVGSWKQWSAADTKPYAAPGTCGVPRGAKK
jgi:branched-chain amino acid transport system substrate-binding protein